MSLIIEPHGKAVPMKRTVRRIGLVVIAAMVASLALMGGPSGSGAAAAEAAPSTTGYSVFTNWTTCPGLPPGTACTHFSPNQETLLLSVTDIYNTTFGGRVGKPLQIDLQCVHYKTVNGVTTGQVGIATVHPGAVTGGVDDQSIAGILSPDTSTTWKTDTHSLAFIHIDGSFVTTHVTTHFSIRSTQIVNNVMNTGIAGQVKLVVSGTLIDATYSNGTFHPTGYTQGQISCTARPTPWQEGEGWGAFNQVVSTR